MQMSINKSFDDVYHYYGLIEQFNY